MKRRLAAVLAGMLGILLLPMVPAQACSCAWEDPREMLAEADAAFIGEFLSSRPGEPPTGSSDDDTIYTFDLSEEFKEDLPDPFDVHSAASGVSCGLEATPGKTYAYFLYLDDGVWRSSLCLQVGPQQLRDAAAPLPDPDGTNPIRFIAGGGFGDGRMVGLDKKGRTLAYGYGTSDAFWVDACPGGRRSVEVIIKDNRENVTLIVRRLRKFQEIRRLELPLDHSYSGTKPTMTNVLCRDQRARSIIVFGTTYHARSRSHLIEVTPDGVETLHRGTAVGAFLSRDFVYMKTGNKGRMIKSFAMKDGTLRTIAEFEGYTYSLAADPGDNYLTIVTHREESDPSRLHVVDIETGETLGSKQILRGGRVYSAQSIWVNANRFVLLPQGGDNGDASVFNRDLEELGSFQWNSYGGVLWHGAVYGIDADGRMLGAELPNGPARVVHKMVSRGVQRLAVVPGHTAVQFDMPD